MDYSTEGVKTLFHANDRSRTIPIKEWITATKHKLVKDGPNSTEYMSGWHVFETFEEAKEYLTTGFKKLKNKVILECFIADDIRPKYHSRANVWLAQQIYLDKIVYHFI